MSAGRPSSFTPKVGTKIVRAVRQGVPMGQAAALVGVTAKTVYDWLARGEQEEEGQFRDFRERFYRARARLCRQAVQVQHNQLADPDPRVSGAASRFMLTHQFSNEFRTRQETSGPDGGPVAVAAEVTGRVAVALFDGTTVASMSPEQLEAAIRACGGAEEEP